MKLKLIILASMLLSPLTQVHADSQKTNVILILADDMRPDALGCTGNGIDHTPNLDRLASRGALFTRATCGYPICHVSRAEILTGRCLANADSPGQAISLDPNWIMWPEAMRRAGWHTAYSGKWHTPGTPQSRGFDETSAFFSSGGAKGAPLTYPLSSTERRVTGYTGWTFKDSDGKFTEGDTVGLTPETDARIADGAIEIIRRLKDKPFFLHVNFTAPHDPLLWPRGFEPRSDASNQKLPENFRPEHPFNHGNLSGRDELIVPIPRNPEDVKRERAVYFALVQNVDAQVGRIVHELEQSGLQDRTLIVFGSDHGLALGSHGLMGKQNQYEHTINVPLIIAGPSVRAGTRSRVQCYLRDLYPTVCELVGVTVPPGVHGRSLIKALDGDPAEVHPAIVGRFTDTQRMIRTPDGWKLIIYPKIHRIQLFNLNDDPLEIANLADGRVNSARIAELTTLLENELLRTGDKTSVLRNE